MTASLAMALAAAAAANVRTFTFVYEATIGPVQAGEGPIDIFLPMAQSDAQQEIVSYRIEAAVPGSEAREARFGNKFWHARVERSDGQAIPVTATYVVRRRAHRNNSFEHVRRNSYTAEELARHGEHLKPDRLAPLSSPIIDPISAAIAPGERSLVKIARAIYDYVIDNMEYKKVGAGWGNGDTHWACTAQYGNCTDFHALFNSLARRRGIPARFEIGFSVAADQMAGEVSGYHCWVEFYLPDFGWVPIDASEAKKYPDRRNLYFGAHPADRVRFTVGRDIQLGSNHRSGPLNYFIYPHVEVTGRRFDAVSVKLRFRERQGGL